jgi:uncharacterized protein YodC (DUF2158 family)
MSSRTSAYTLKVGDLAVVTGSMGGPAMRITGFSYVNQGTCQGATAKLESFRRHDEDEARPAPVAEFPVDGLRVLREGHRAATSPFYAFDISGRDIPT